MKSCRALNRRIWIWANIGQNSSQKASFRSARQQPEVREVYKEAFTRWCCSGMVGHQVKKRYWCRMMQDIAGWSVCHGLSFDNAQNGCQGASILLALAGTNCFPSRQEGGACYFPRCMHRMLQTEHTSCLLFVRRLRRPGRFFTRRKIAGTAPRCVGVASAETGRPR